MVLSTHTAHPHCIIMIIGQSPRIPAAHLDISNYSNSYLEACSQQSVHVSQSAINIINIINIFYPYPFQRKHTLPKTSDVPFRSTTTAGGAA